MKIKTNKNQKLLLAVILVLSLIAIAVSAYLTHIHYMVTDGGEAFSSFCNINESINCDAVAASAWSKLFGIPISLWGIFFYAFIALLCLIKLCRATLKKIPIYLFWLSVLGIGYTVFLIYVSNVLLDVWCLLCAVLWIVNILFFVFSWINNPITMKDSVKELWKDVRYLTSHWTRVLLIIIVLGSFIALLFYTTHREAEKQRKYLELKPVFAKLITPLSLEGPFIGSSSPRLTIVEFTDFQCHHCKKLHELLKDIVKKNDRIKVIHKDLPLDQACNPLITRPFHTKACATATFVRCTTIQNKYWPAFQLAFKNQSKLKQDLIFESMAKELGIDYNKIQQCQNSEATKNALAQEIEEATGNGLNGTPVIIFGSEHQLLSGWTKGKLEKAITYWLSKSR